MDELGFSFKEDPEWRDADTVPSTSSMVTQITEWRRAYETFEPEGAKQFCTQQFAQAMAVDYVHYSNVGELVGTQSKQRTEEVLYDLSKYNLTRLQSEQLGGAARSEIMETVNTYKALKELNKTHDTMDYTGLLTVQEICDVHRVLLGGLHADCGKLRTREAYTHWGDGTHFYPSPTLAEEMFYALIDRYNMLIANCSLDRSTEDYTGYVFKLAASLLFKFVDIHPFCDGNGRTCRLLASYTVGVITPFPVVLYQNPERDSREDYLQAIVRCREHPSEGPRDLAAMLVEGAWRGWRDLFRSLQRQH